jgi:hypothetical protein
MSYAQAPAPLHERIRVIDRDGKQILLVDLAHCKSRTVEEVMRKVPDAIASYELGSALVLTDLTGASFDGDAMMALKEAAVFDKPYIKKSAIVGWESLPRRAYGEIKAFARREWMAFRSRSEAISWLNED